MRRRGKTARGIVLSSAQAAWDNRQTVDGLPLFGRSGTAARRSRRPGGRQAQSVDGAVNSSEIPERDLSVQAAGWMLMEAAYRQRRRLRCAAAHART